MDYREQLLNRALLMLNEAGIKELDKIKNVLTKAISQYEITERCTDIAVIDDSNSKLMKMFLAAKKIEGGSIRTGKLRWSVIRMFDKDVNKRFTEISSFDILNWLATIQARVSLATANNYRNVLAALFKWMTENGFIEKNPMAHIKAIKHPDPIKKPFTPVEVDSLKQACKTRLDRALVEVMLSTGLRCEELCNLKWKDIDFSTKDVKVIEGKGNKNRVTMMDDIAMKYLMQYRDGLDYSSEYVFAVRYGGEIKCRTTDSVWRKLKDLAKRAKVSEANPHKFRHTFATTLYKRGLDVRMIQKLLGHSNINTTMIYIDGDVSMLRDAYKRCC